MIPFNRPPYIGSEDKFLNEAIHSDKISGDGDFSQRCHKWFEQNMDFQKVLLTSSCTHALEIAAILINIKPGDEVIMPSYTFVSTANAFALRGAKIVFVDIRPDTMNIDEKLIEHAITDKTKAIVTVHYAGVACEMDYIMELAARYKLYVIEDAAQGMVSKYKDRSLGGIGHLSAFSFHETKNYTSGGEGGLLIINDENLIERAEIIREKGTNRSKFFRGEVDKYTWVDIGSSYLPSELQAAYLYAQLLHVDEINSKRLALWKRYFLAFKLFEKNELLKLPTIPSECEHNAHMFYLKCKDAAERQEFIKFMRDHDVYCVFHYVPLHTSPAGKKLSRFCGEDRYTTYESERIVRLPLFYNMTYEQQDKVINAVNDFYSKKR